jgi:mRNA interferase YafQ
LGASFTVLQVGIPDESLAERYRDHPLLDDCAGFPDCQIKPDLVLIDEKAIDTTLLLVRVGFRGKLGS